MLRLFKYMFALLKAKRNEKLSRSQIKQMQFDKLRRLLQHAKKNVPYYREILKGIEVETIEDIQKIPFLTKQLIIDEKEGLKSQHMPKKRFVEDSTSGSTGAAMHFYTDKKKNWVRHACAYRGDSWTGWRLREPKVIIWGAERDFKKGGTLYHKLWELFFNTTILSSFYMTDQDMDAYITIINDKRPALIVGYPSSLELFAQYIQSNDRTIYSPKGIITGGEALYEEQRSMIQSVFHCKVLNRYGCRDVGHIANECECQKGLHINDDHLLLEIVDEHGTPCKPGELGEIIITDLDNYVFPFIRYRIGDLGVLSDRVCPCGRQLGLLESVDGRSFDLIIGQNGNRVLAIYFTLYLKHHISGIKRFQLHQNHLDSLDLILEVTPNFNASEEEKLIKGFRQKLGETLQVNIQIVDEIPLTANGKFRWVISSVSPFTN